MSTPITNCLVAKATRDEKAYRVLLNYMKVNLACGHWSQWPCEHKPPCEMPNEEALAKLNERLTKDLEGIESDSGPTGIPGPPGNTVDSGAEK